MTSHDCVWKIRKMLKTKKVGHTGTLDPDVTGVLPICLGRATKVAEYMTNDGKEYEGEVILGFSTTTEDASGDVVERKPIERPFTRKEIEEVLHSLTGEILQTPPMYSAVKVNGKRLYEYARKGIHIERPTRKVTIYELRLLHNEQSFSGETVSFQFRVRCSKGTYIRTLAVMIGEKLGYPAHMKALTRTASGPFTQSDAIPFSVLAQHLEAGTLSDIIAPLEKGLSHLPQRQVSADTAAKLRNGAVLPTPEWWTDHQKQVVFYEGKSAIAIYQVHPRKSHVIKPVKVLQIDSLKR